MSSILDALNKLELERAEADHLPGRNSIAPKFIGRERVGRSAPRDRFTFRVSLFTMILAGSVFALVLVSLSVGASLMILRGSDSNVAVLAASGAGDVGAASLGSGPPESAAAVEPEASPATPPEPVTEEAPAAVVSASPNEEAPRSIQDVSTQDVEVTPVVHVATVPPEPAVEVEKIVVAERAAPSTEAVVAETGVLSGARAVGERPVGDLIATERPTAVAQIVVPKVPGRPSGLSVGARSEEEPTVQSIAEYPMLTRADSERYADGQLRINMLRPVSSMNPYGFAFINRIKIYEGQKIDGTSLLLIGVEYGGVGVQVQDTGQRYFISF